MKRLFFVILGMVLLVGCSGKRVIDETRTFANATWNRFQPEKFEVTVDNIDDYYRIDFEVVVDSAKMRNDQLPLTVNLYSPEGERRMFYTYIDLTENGRWKGEPQKGRSQEGMRVMNQNIRPYFTFNSKGTYRMEIGQATSQYDLDGVESLRLVIEKAEIDLSDFD